MLIRQCLSTDVSLRDPTVVCSSQIPPKLLPESSSHDDHGTAAANTSADRGTGNQTTGPKDSSLVSASNGPVGASSSPLSGSLSCQPGVTQRPECKSTGQETLSKQSLVADQKLPGRATRSSQSPKKPFNSIIEHLSVVFPCYNRYGYKLSVTVKYLNELRFPDQITFWPVKG